MNTAKRNTALFCTAIGITAVAGFLISCATIDHVVVAPPVIPGAKYVGNDACATCHEKVVKNFQLAQHSRIQLRALKDQADKGVDRIGCEGCHGPGSLHVEAGGGKGKFIVNAGKNPETCFQCHLDKKAQFSLPYHHPVAEGRMSCSDCHDPHGDDIKNPKGMFVARVNEVCAKCHREQARPRVFEHEALREGCVTCHNIHGSINDKMLVERDSTLCLKCHGQVNAQHGKVQIGGRTHATNMVFNTGSLTYLNGQPNGLLTRGTCFSAGCHTAMHGSDLNPHLRY